MSDLLNVIIQFIRDNFIAGRSDIVFDNDESIIEKGIMDSTGVLELVEFLESTYSITIEDHELVPENLETINNILKYLKTKGIE
jgi:acyl carrier protein